MSAGSGTPLRTPSDFYSNPNWYRCEARPHSTSSARRLGPKIGRPLSSRGTDKKCAATGPPPGRPRSQPLCPEPPCPLPSSALCKENLWLDTWCLSLTSCSLMWRKHQCKRLWAILLFESMLQTRLPRVGNMSATKALPNRPPPPL